MRKLLGKHLVAGLVLIILLECVLPCYCPQPVGALESSTSDSSDSSVDPDLTVEDVKVEGNRLIPVEDIMAVVKTRRGDRFDRKQVVEDLKAVNAMGYFDDSHLQALPEITNNGVLLKIRVQENAPVTQFAFEGNRVLSTEEIANAFSGQLGKPQSLSQLSSAIDKVEQAYHEKGYVLARVVDVKDDPDGSISLSINEGEIDDIQIVGNKKTKDFIIRHAVKLKPGSAYNERQLTGDLRKLMANGYFQDIRRSLAPSTKDPDKYTLKVEVDEKRTSSIGLGMGVDTTYGPFGSFNIGDSNFLGRGQVFSFASQIGTGSLGNIQNSINNGGREFLADRRSYQFETSWVEPNLRGSNTALAVSGAARDFPTQLVDQAGQRTLGGAVSFSRPLTRHLSGSLGFTGENTKLFDGSWSNLLYGGEPLMDYLSQRALELGRASDSLSALQVAQQIRDKQLKGGTFVSVSPSLVYDTRDNPMNPSKGTRALLTASPTLGLSGSSYLRLGTSVTHYVPVSKSATLAVNAQGGTGLGSMPQFSQYQLGGWNGLRGYRAFSDLGTGSAVLMASAELRMKLPIPGAGRGGSKIANAIQQSVKGVVFFDAGQVSGNGLTNNFYERSGLGASVGVGLRVRAPFIGLVRIDYGFPLISSLLGRMTPRVTLGLGDKF